MSNKNSQLERDSSSENDSSKQEELFQQAKQFYIDGIKHSDQHKKSSAMLEYAKAKANFLEASKLFEKTTHSINQLNSFIALANLAGSRVQLEFDYRAAQSLQIEKLQFTLQAGEIFTQLNNSELKQYKNIHSFKRLINDVNNQIKHYRKYGGPKSISKEQLAEYSQSMTNILAHLYDFESQAAGQVDPDKWAAHAPFSKKIQRPRFFHANSNTSSEAEALDSEPANSVNPPNA